jgi:prepilin-type N-terminal cleavage/methylation domain-containing protein
MKNKGFTLLEIMATLIIIGIVFLITVPTIGNIINDMRKNAFLESEKGLIRAAQNYLGFYEELYPNNVGEVAELSIATLVDEKFVKEVKNPVDGTLCSGYIIIKKIADEEYEYYPEYRCGDEKTIISTTLDELILNYNFDDFQEPTTNVSPSYIVASAGNYTNYLLTPEFDSIMSPNGIEDATKLTATASGQVRTEFSIASPAANTYYTFSVYAKKGSTPYAALYTYFAPYDSPVLIANLETATITTNLYTTDSSIEEIGNGWYRIAMTVLVRPDQTNRLFKINQTSSSTSVTSGGPSGEYVYYWGAQLEQKDHLTPFTETSRTGTVTDYSINQNEAPLVLANTPRWVEASRLDSGSYQFDGTNKSILTTNTLDVQGDQTYSFWINPSSVVGLQGLVALHNHTATSNFGVNLNGNKISISIGYTDATREYSTKNSVASIPTSAWTYVTVAHDSTLNNVKIYINGVLDSTHSIAKTVKYTTEKLLIGQWSTTYLGNYMYSGYIDNVRIYNRTLSADEIATLYYIEGSR